MSEHELGAQFILGLDDLAIPADLYSGVVEGTGVSRVSLRMNDFKIKLSLLLTFPGNDFEIEPGLPPQTFLLFFCCNSVLLSLNDFLLLFFIDECLLLSLNSLGLLPRCFGVKAWIDYERVLQYR